MNAEVTIIVRDTDSPKAADTRARVINFEQVGASQITSLTGAYAEAAAADLFNQPLSAHANQVFADNAGYTK